MTRKDFQIIANAIKEVNQRKAKGERIAQLFADALQNTNPNFNRERFIEATK